MLHLGQDEVVPSVRHRAIDKINAAGSDDAVVKQYKALLENLNSIVLDRFGGRDYSAVFEKYIQA
jgi:hypothetical protein